jgi:hypothetical protein
LVSTPAAPNCGPRRRPSIPDNFNEVGQRSPPWESAIFEILDIQPGWAKPSRKDFSVTSQPLSDFAFDRLSDILGRLGDKRAMNLEQLDGFLAAVI